MVLHITKIKKIKKIWLNKENMKIILTLCFQITLYAVGFACTLHSKYTSSPSSMSSGFKFEPSSSNNVGITVKKMYGKLYCLL